MKKLISIGVVLALLAMVVVPVSVAAQLPADAVYNSTYSKIPFGILGTGINLIADMWPDLDTALGIGMPWVANVLGSVGNWTMGPFSWLTELTAWSMVAVGDVMAKGVSLLSLFGVTLDLSSVPSLFYVIGNRMFDTGNIPTANMTAQLPPALGL